MKPTNPLAILRSGIALGLISLVTLLLTSCERLFMQPAPKTDPSSIFNEAWTFVDREYSYFDYKKVDWDSVKTVYQARVDKDMTDEALFEVIADMLYLLRDGHVNLSSDFDRSRNWTWFLNYPANFDAQLVERSYFKEQQQYVGPFVVYDFGDVGYIQYSDFLKLVTDADMRYVLKKFANHKGLIMDVRDNRGGAVANVSMIAKYFTTSNVVVGKEIYRNGPNHIDFSEPEDFTISPADSLVWQKPVVVLTNRLCYSATTFFSQTMRELPSVTLLGDTTGGGGGAPSATELANGWMLRASNTRLLTPAGLDVEGGVPPDTVVSLRKEDTDAGFDTLIEEALKRIRR